MTQRTGAVLAVWPFDWREWDVVIDRIARQLPMSRRSVANRAAWLLRNSKIERLWAFDGNNEYLGTLTRRAE